MALEVKISEDLQRERRERNIIPIIMETIENEGYGPAWINYKGERPCLGEWIWAWKPPEDAKPTGFTIKRILDSINGRYETIKSLKKPRELYAHRKYPLIRNIGIIDETERTDVKERDWPYETWRGTTIGGVCYSSLKESLKIEIFGEKFISRLSKLGKVLHDKTQLKPEFELVCDCLVSARIYVRLAGGT